MIAKDRTPVISKAKRVYKNNYGLTEAEFENGIIMVYIPGGEFTVGSVLGDLREKPRKINLDGFWIGKHEVTQNQWKVIEGYNPSSFKRGDNYPVENISWKNTKKYIKKLNKKVGLNFRLPTEGEWEYACLAGSNSIYCFGNEKYYLKGYAWYNLNDGTSNGTHPVGRKKPNRWGLFDMHGNVSEWCQGHSDHPPFRGGAWGDTYNLLASYRRASFGPIGENSAVGFRLALSNR